MKIILSKRFGKPEPSRSVMALVSGRHTPGADDHADAGHYPILSLHWPNFPAPATEAERAAA
jgi:hypothetical protein